MVLIEDQADDRLVALKRKVINPIILLTIDFHADQGGTQRWTCNNNPIIIGADTWTRIGTLQEATIPESKETVGRDRYTLRFLDASGDLRTKFVASGFTGIPLLVQLVFADGQGGVTSPLTVYKGSSAAPIKEITPEGPVLIVHFVGQLAQITGARIVRLTDDAQKARRAGDSSLKYIHVTRNLSWGRNN